MNITYLLLLLLLSNVNGQIPTELQPLDGFTTLQNGIAWAKVYECTEMSVGNVPYEAPFNNMAGFTTLAQYAISVRIEATNGDQDFAVQTVTCSNPIFNLNNGYEMSYVTNIATQLITGYCDLNDWTGTDAAKDRLTVNCYKGPAGFNKVPRTFTTSRLFHACGNAEGIHLSIPGESTYGTCRWADSTSYNRPIVVYLGYDESLETWCSDNTNSKYSYTPAPTPNPTPMPTKTTVSPTRKPTKVPTTDPTKPPTNNPTEKPTKMTGSPTRNPTKHPTSHPTKQPTNYPTKDPTNDPTKDPTFDPTIDPTEDPTIDPTTDPTSDPTADPTIDPTMDPTDDPTKDPTSDPTDDPTSDPTIGPTSDPTADPTIDPTIDPTNDPTSDPTNDPTFDPTIDPTSDPTSDPTNDPTMDPTNDPTADPTSDPTKYPSMHPTADPTNYPTTGSPSASPTKSPTVEPTVEPSLEPTNKPTINPTPSPTYCYNAKYQNIMENGDYLWPNQLFVSDNCLCQLKLQRDGNLILYGKMEINDEFINGWMSNTKIANRSGQSAPKLEMNNNGIILNEYIYKNVPAIPPNLLWSKIFNDNLCVYLSDNCCLNVMDINSNQIVWYICADGIVPTLSPTKSSILITNKTTDCNNKKCKKDKASSQNYNNSDDLWWVWLLIVIFILILMVLIVICKQKRKIDNNNWIKPTIQQQVYTESVTEKENERQTMQEIDKWVKETNDNGVYGEGHEDIVVFMSDIDGMDGNGQNTATFAYSQAIQRNEMHTNYTDIELQPSSKCD